MQQHLAPGGEFDGITQEVVENLAQQAGVADPGRTDFGGDGQQQPIAVGQRGGRVAEHHLLEQIDAVDGIERGLQGSRSARSRPCAESRNQPPQLAASVLDGARPAFLLGIQAGFAEQLAHAEQAVEYVVELVAQQGPSLLDVLQGIVVIRPFHSNSSLTVQALRQWRVTGRAEPENSIYSARPGLTTAAAMSPVAAILLRPTHNSCHAITPSRFHSDPDRRLPGAVFPADRHRGRGDRLALPARGAAVDTARLRVPAGRPAAADPGPVLELVSPFAPQAARHREPRTLTAEALQDELVESAAQGVDVSAALEEIREQRRRRGTGEIHIAVYGEVSSGKSSLVNALLPEAKVETDPRAGTTTTIRHYAWLAPSGDRVTIADLPGFNLEDDTAAIEETRRAHLVIFLCDADLTNSQVRQLKFLQERGKPLVLALNKADRYTPDELAGLLAEIQRKTGLGRKDVVAVSTGGREEVVRLLGEGIEQRDARERRPEIAALRDAVQRHLDDNRELMESLRETAVLTLASEKLEAARHQHRRQRADELVNTYARRAVIGALAAVAPGSDLVIQGVLATRLVRELSRLYDVPVKEIEIESFLELAGGKIRNMTAITLAIAGNASRLFRV
jgi:GTP-binding protein EngB required for normal cell division